MKRLSELPERDTKDETQKLNGTNPAKLLAATPTEDVLVKPEDLVAQITGGAGSSDTWARLEQVKEAYEKGPECKVANDYRKLCPHWYNPQTSTLFVYTPNSKSTITHSVLGVPRGTALKEINITVSEPYDTGNRWEFGLRAPVTNFTCTASGAINNPQHRLYDFFYPGSIIYPSKVNINFPNATKLNNAPVSDLYNHNLRILHEINLLAPNVTNCSAITSGISSISQTIRRGTLSLYAYFPKLNTSVLFGFNNTIYALAYGIAFHFEPIKYFLDNINKAPTAAGNTVDVATIIKTGTKSPMNITITATSTTGDSVNSPILLQSWTSDADVTKAINDDITHLGKAVEALTTPTENHVYVKSRPGWTITNVDAGDASDSFDITLTPRSTTGSPLVISCSVDEKLGDYADPVNKIGWMPKDSSYGNLLSTVNQFLVDCNFKWVINWYPVLGV